MFDKLIVCEPEGADFKNRRTYFVVSSLVVGVLFVTAVVFSIYAADIGLGSNRFELVEIVSPPDMAAAEPEPRQQRTMMARSQNPVPTRQVNMSRVDEPTIVPTTTSVVANNQAARPRGYFEISKVNSDPQDTYSTGRETTGPSNGPGLSPSGPAVDVEKEAETPPPAVRKVPRPERQVSGGVMNGKAIDLPKPVYSAAAKSIGAQGQVQVQVLIDESGRVISANAMGGHPMLRTAAEDAARKARFTPTLLTGAPVKVTGVIVYNFTR